eukprot:CAMPEP_0196580980 /NCGR_PEP_ID=MMETSP1081-20130531/31818_1 /TAXON_ID=36882 /ORGANISM="Pyramimonas amylifera, Strain CCMP720" /LENGTH=348 /DNA_ID=CAMNT_0041901043 /DNA_START=76 /DNA_END=1122 /DNA_ORIENTATION=+
MALRKKSKTNLGPSKQHNKKEARRASKLAQKKSFQALLADANLELERQAGTKEASIPTPAAAADESPEHTEPQSGDGGHLSTDAAAQAWLRSEEKVTAWLNQYNFKELLQQGQGIVHIQNFFPESVAESILRRIEGVPQASYEAASSEKYDSVEHRFSLAEMDNDDFLLDISKVLWRMMPSTLPNFSIGRYSKNDHISPHDDKVLEQYTRKEYQEKMGKYLGCDPKDVPLTKALKTNHEIDFSREVALVYYLNKDWKTDFGGLFIDLEADKPYLPEFNNLVAFTVPRMHGVTPVVSKSKSNPRKRYSIFGWWLVEGRLYDDEDDIYGEKASSLAKKAGGKQKKTQRKH